MTRARGGGASPRRRPTLRDIAARASVAAATASLVLRSSPLVAAATRAREAASAPGYVHDRGAAALRTGCPHTVGLAINDLSNPYFARLTAAVEQALDRLGWSVFLCDTREHGAEAARARRRVVLGGEPPSAVSLPWGCVFRTRCPIARPLCGEAAPPLAAVLPGRLVACLFPGEFDGSTERCVG